MDSALISYGYLPPESGVLPSIDVPLAEEGDTTPPDDSNYGAPPSPSSHKYIL